MLFQLMILPGVTQLSSVCFCSGYADYEECLEPIQTACPEGVHRVYQVENEWHRMVDIAKYLCNHALQG